MTQTIASLEGYVRKIQQIQPTGDEVLLYRGHSRRDFKLLPSVLRDPMLAKAEHAILRELVASHPAEFAPDSTTLEQLARAQHYSLPTRLLDATWNPLVALYFAAREHPNRTGEVVVFRIKRDRVQFYDSDTVSCLANLAHLKPAVRDSMDFALMGKAFNAQDSVRRLLHWIRLEKPPFRGEIIPSDLQTVLCVKPKRNSQRILVQAGAFLLFGVCGSLDSNPVPHIAVDRIMVNGGRKNEILKQLDTMTVNESTMFPEIERAAEYIRSKV